jgi:hypothetical protein
MGKRNFNRVNYKNRYQDKKGNLIFRYDNDPHYPNLSTFPAHIDEGEVI